MISKRNLTNFQSFTINSNINMKMLVLGEHGRSYNQEYSPTDYYRAFHVTSMHHFRFVRYRNVLEMGKHRIKKNIYINI